MVAATRAAEPTARPIGVVVGRASPVTHVSMDELRDLYLRRRRFWPDGTRAVPINLPADNPVRQRFSTLVLGRGVQDLLSYWDARYYEGITPPTVLPSAAAVRAYLATEPGAVAYLPLGDVDDTCRVLTTLDQPAARGGPP